MSRKMGKMARKMELFGLSPRLFGDFSGFPAVPVPLSVSGKTVPTVPVSGSGSVPEPPCMCN